MKLYNLRDVLEEIEKIEKKGKSWICEVKSDNSPRTNAQNRLYWKNIHILAGFTGNTPEEMHALIKDKMLKEKKKIKIGKKTRTVYIEKSTTELDTKQFSELMERVYAIGEYLHCEMIRPEEPLPEWNG